MNRGDFPNEEILKAIVVYAENKTRIEEKDIKDLLKEMFDIDLKYYGYKTFIRQTYSYIRYKDSVKQAKLFKIKVVSTSLYSK